MSIAMFLVLLMSLHLGGAASAQIRDVAGPFIPLSGQHAFRADPSDDWRPVPLPGLWQRQGVSAFTEQGWYRIRFSVPDGFVTDEPAFLAYLLGQDEVWLNGTRIGGSEHFTLPGQGLRPFVAFAQLRIYAIPVHLLRHQQTNTILIRMNRSMLLENGGIADFVFGIADRRHAWDARARAEQIIRVVDGALLSVNTMMLCIALVARMMGIKHGVVWAAVRVTFTMSLAAWCGTTWLMLPGGATPWLSSVSLIVGFAVIGFNLHFVASSLEVATGPASRILPVLMLFIIIPSGILPFAVPDPVRIAAIFAALACAAGAVFWLMRMGVVAARHGANMGWVLCGMYFVLLGVPVIWGALVPELVVGIGALTGRPPIIFGVQIVTLILAGIFGHHVFRFESESMQANDRALRAQEEERQRVARDMHDSVGQWLAAIKMRLQAMAHDSMAGEAPESEGFQELLGDMDVLIDDTRRIAHDLSATSMARGGLRSAIADHLALLTDDFGVQTDLQYPARLDISVRVADHLYRIVQEATANAVNHGAATTINVQVQLLDGRLLMVISDNGTGFDVDAGTDAAGLGLASIRDRAAMLHGRAQILSARGHGTEIRISILRAAVQGDDQAWSRR